MYPAQSSTDGGSQSRTSFNEKALPRPWKFDIKGFLSKLWGLPLFVICGQLILQIAAWGFFAYIQSRGFLPLPRRFQGDRSADWYRPLTWLSTQISAGLAGLSCYLFALGIQQSITLHLHGEGMPMPKFILSIQIARRSFIGDLKKLKLTALSLAVMLVTGAQTAGWSNLITPQFLDFESSITGRELDLSSTLLQSSLPDPVHQNCVFDNSNNPAFTVGQTESGYAAVNQDLEFPASVILLGQSFVSSTGGILPLTFGNVTSDSWFPNQTTLPATLSIHGDLPNDLSVEYSISQQGYTADVSCQFQDLEKDTTPSLDIETSPLEDEDGTVLDINSIIMSSDCTGPRSPDGPLNLQTVEASLGSGSGHVLMIVCGGSGQSYTLIFSGAGLYDFVKTTVCTLTPKITKVLVDYSNDNSSDDSYNDFLNSTVIDTQTLSGGSPDLDGPAGLSAVATIYNMMHYSQGKSTNIVGDQLTSLILNGNLVVQEEYLRGVTEYSGSVFRACLSVTGENAPFRPAGVPNTLTIPVGKSSFDTEFLGWEISTTTSLVQIPGTLIAIATIYIVLAAVARHSGDQKGKAFDPANTLDLVSASAIGGLRDVFTGTEEDRVKESEAIHIVLEDVEGRGPMFQGRAIWKDGQGHV
ncbi:hypothetical protein DFH08DRAFT_881191 [Mycena albidolilacea]|uniref:Uncharacterized protein n=1 Tax=Mycena albidolilacea TaxID=1033008 RepID=A0AAD6ZPR0_9AGAR|nr:hypothetical protein DFH08DRAFT_881191 [Mycena albidolilacea]